MSVNAKMTAIADEVRTLAGVADKLNLDDMATHTHDANTEVGTQENLIEQIRTALQGKSAVGDAEPIIHPLEITENGTYTAPDGVDGYSPIDVNVPIPDGYIKPSGTKEITENGTHDAKAYESVNVNVPIPDGYIVPSGELEITENGEYDITDKASVIVAVEESEGGGIEHTYTVDYIPSVNTRAFTISIPGFSFAPSYVDCRAVTEIPNQTGLQGAVRFSVYNNFRISNNPTAYTQGVVITKRTDGGSDYWNVFSRVTATDKEVIIDATTQNTWEFIAGVTYRFIVVEGSG